MTGINIIAVQGVAMRLLPLRQIDITLFCPVALMPE